MVTVALEERRIKMDKRKFWGSILGTTMFLVMLLGLTYAYYTWRSSDTSLTFSISDAYFNTLLTNCQLFCD